MAKPGTDTSERFPVAAVATAIGELRRLLPEAEDRVFADALDALRPATVAPPPRQALPVCRHMSAALAAAMATPAGGLARALAELAEAAFWAQNPNYRQSPPADGFLDGYGYFVLAGPADGPPAFIETPDLALGFLLLSPGTLYPAHSHPAVELYVALGDGEWQAGDGPWSRQPAGAVLRHAENQPHAIRAREAPLLAAYLWRGELASYARLTPGAGRR